MSRHRAQPPPRFRPRYGRIGVVAASIGTTAIALLGGLGVLPSAADDVVGGGSAAQVNRAVDPQPAAPTSAPTSAPAAAAEPSPSPVVEPLDEEVSDLAAETDEPALAPIVRKPPLPADSGTGRRAVFSQSQQRVWLVTGGGHVKRTFLVSGSVTDNLDPGTYQVFSRSEDAYGIDNSGTMKWFVRFTRGPSGAAIGFHSIPVFAGAPVQSKADLGTEQSHGCIRQKTVDAKAMWRFAQLGDTVVVTP